MSDRDACRSEFHKVSAGFIPYVNALGGNRPLGRNLRGAARHLKGDVGVGAHGEFVDTHGQREVSGSHKLGGINIGCGNF